jgi:predicted transcriptional regulator
MAEQSANADLLGLTAGIVAAQVSNNTLSPAEVLTLIHQVYKTLSEVGQEPASTARPEPAVPITKSVFPDHIVCLEDGRKLKMLKRYLRARYGMTPDVYRAKWNLPADYPMTAPNYAARRSEFAKQIGLGRPRKKRG